jgi:hypothetical protein
MHINRGLLFWGLALVTAGVVALAAQQNYVDRDTLAGAWRLWPLILIAIGLSIVLARTPFSILGTITAALVLGIAGGAVVSVGPSFAVNCGGDDPVDLTTDSGAFDGDSASVNLDFTCGTLVVGTADGGGWVARTGTTGDREIRVRGDGDELSIRSPEGGFGVDSGRQRWEVELGSDLTYELDVSMNAGSSTFDLAGLHLAKLEVDPNAGDLFFDLSGATVDDFDFSMNAGNAEVLTDADTDIDGSLDMNAGSFKLCTDASVGLRFTVNANFTFSHNLDDEGLNESGDTWTSDNFDGAAHQIVMRLGGNAASFELNPEGGCS